MLPARAYSSGQRDSRSHCANASIQWHTQQRGLTAEMAMSTCCIKRTYCSPAQCSWLLVQTPESDDFCTVTGSVTASTADLHRMGCRLFRMGDRNRSDTYFPQMVAMKTCIAAISPEAAQGDKMRIPQLSPARPVKKETVKAGCNWPLLLPSKNESDHMMASSCKTSMDRDVRPVIEAALRAADSS